jgi:hypothetical protein
MTRYRVALVLVMLAAFAPPAPAGIFFNRRPKPNPNERVPALLSEVKTEREDHKRESAAEELAKYDPKSFPEMVPVLVEVSQQDQSAGVRLEALRTLSHLRPVSPQAGRALEQAAEKDAAVRVRVQARTLLWQYRLAGYHPGGKGEPPLASAPTSTREPPLAAPLTKPAAQTPPPPVADPKVARPLPIGSASDGPALTPPQ